MSMPSGIPQLIGLLLALSESVTAFLTTTGDDTTESTDSFANLYESVG